MTTEEPNHLEAQTREPNNFCEVAGQQCFQNYCDENGCQDRKRRYTALGISLLHNNDLLKHLLENLANQEQSELVVAELTARLAAPVVESRPEAHQFAAHVPAVVDAYKTIKCLRLELPAPVWEDASKRLYKALGVLCEWTDTESAKAEYWMKAADGAAPVAAAEAAAPQWYSTLAAAGRGEWKWKPYKPTEEEMQAAFKASLSAGAEVYCPHWSSKMPFLIFPEVDEQGVSYYCTAWADKVPERKTWPEFFDYLHANPGLSHLAAAPVTLEGEPRHA